MTSLLDDYMPEDELAQQLHVTRKTIHRWHQLGIAPPKTKIGRRVYYKRDSTKVWIARREQPMVSR